MICSTADSWPVWLRVAAILDHFLHFHPPTISKKGRLLNTIEESTYSVYLGEPTFDCFWLHLMLSQCLLKQTDLSTGSADKRLVNSITWACGFRSPQRLLRGGLKLSYLWLAAGEGRGNTALPKSRETKTWYKKYVGTKIVDNKVF